MRTVQQVLADASPAWASELLLQKLSDAAAGKDISNSVSEIVQARSSFPLGLEPLLKVIWVGSRRLLLSFLQGIFRTRWNAQVKKLAYQLCKAVPVSDADSQHIIAGIRVRAEQHVAFHPALNAFNAMSRVGLTASTVGAKAHVPGVPPI